MEAALIAAAILIAVGAPLAIIAGVGRRNHELAAKTEQLRRYEAYTAVVARIEAQNVGPAQKMIAVRQLREFPEYRDLTVVMCNSIQVNGTGPAAEIFQNELKVTEQYLLKAEQ
ncbi:hypothetical protein KCG44_06315 [Pacificimonas sp. WHA3]|uniref:Uncharacterized protein n=1 Tax=Pacificimonas pallii TaxID=2827236 RepID=A0ABS6SE79_9SPHN|nr:hypothetical protein [Pacificimonas pallii]MBV7256398.1 hypothetical protein [Pacificimonas pallii]